LFSLFLFLLCVSLAPMSGHGQTTLGFTCQPGSNITSTFLGSPYVVVLPTNWNKVLVVFAHGYDLYQPSPEELLTPILLPGLNTSAELLEKGYGLLAASYRNIYDSEVSGGWAVEQALADLVTLTNTVNMFGCDADYTILFGISMGSVVALASAERYPNVYDGIVAGCTAGAGTTLLLDSSLIVNVLYDAAFMNQQTGSGGWPAAWGTPQEISPSFNFTSAEQTVKNQLQNPFNQVRWEFVKYLGQLPSGNNPTLFEEFFLEDFYFSTNAILELQRRCQTTKVTSGVGYSFELSPSALDYLSSSDFNATMALEYLNNRITGYRSDQSARSYLHLYADYTGRVRVPILSIHTIFDELITVTSETVYKDLLESTGNADLLYQAYFNETGHCNFDTVDIVQAIDAMYVWLSEGTKPSATSFKDSPNFLPTYNPGPYLYPKGTPMPV